MPKDHEKKVERAFEVVERLEKKEKAGKKASGSAGPGKKQGAKGAAGSGLRVNFSLDALISEKDTRAAREKDLRAGKSNLLNIKFTVPYVWQIPVVGKTALKLIKRLQGDAPESIRDILDSFRRKKPL